MFIVENSPFFEAELLNLSNFLITSGYKAI